MDVLKGRKYCVVSKWCYPFGGGEEFLYQSMEWAHNLGMECTWLCFTKNGEPFDELLIEDANKYGKIIKVPGGLTPETLYNWLKLLKPCIVHHQGHQRVLFYDVCEKLRIEFLSGFHFWTGGIVLDPISSNTEILKNYQRHITDQDLTYLIEKKEYCNLYTVTPFVSECIEKITGHKIRDNIFASSSYSRCKIPNFDPWDNTYVSMINIHKLKGGELLLFLLEELTNIPFLGVKTEFMSEELDNQIELAAKTFNSKSQIIQRVTDPKEIFKKTKIFLAPSLVDETFCRTVNEAMMNGIPVLTTGNGNLRYLVDDDEWIIPIDNKKRWKETITKLYYDKEYFKKASSHSLQKYDDFSETKAIQQFKNVVTKTIRKSKEYNIMILTPWCDQGLGIQSRNYYNILIKNNYNPSVFAIKPYNATTCIELQKKPEEWIIDNIYYSSNDREKITDIDIIEFVKRYNIGKCILPETCWFRVFEIAKLLRLLNVKCYAIPNIEIVRKDEIFKHKYFYKILANNYICKTYFENYGFTNVHYIGYGIHSIEEKKKVIDIDVIKYLFIGGMNAFSRKHILEVCEGFVKAYESNKNIQLICTVQKTNSLENDQKLKIEQYLQHPAIKIIQNHLSYEEIVDLYHNNHITIQVSKHEGLGLGFYESLASGTPVITLNTPPHNEIIVHQINGWIIDCYYEKMTDNTKSLFDSANFYPEKLAELICSITKNKLQNVLNTLHLDNQNRLNYHLFENKFIESLNH